ncbi:VOC family protein [Tundrisphaera lichenicola]|uniref:VOC family protein n=1 Tax=Tundrisphaera lichenicola TaxID=2029860 RepID=UPI003EBFE522
MDHPIVHFEIPADDPERASKFYRDAFGWEISRMPGPMEYYGVRTSETEANGMPKGPGINGGICRKMNPGHMPTNYVAVADIEAHTARMVEAGATLILPRMPVPGMGWLAQFLDTEGNPIALWQSDTSATMDGYTEAECSTA